MKQPKILLYCSDDSLIKHIRECITNICDLRLLPSNSFPHAVEGEEEQLAILHLQPPDFSAIEKLEEFKKIHPHLNTVVMASAPKEAEIIQAFRGGAKDFITLPLQPEELTFCLHKYLRPKKREESKGFFRAFLAAIAKLFKSNGTNTQSQKPVPIKALGISSIPFASDKAAPLNKVNPDWKVQLMGNFNVSFKGESLLNLPGKKTNALLAYFLHKHPTPLHRDTLMENFWGEVGLESARNSLNVAIYALRKGLDEIGGDRDYIIYNNGLYSFHPDLVIEKDVDFFLSYWHKGKMLEQTKGMAAAVETYHQSFAFYRGDFLEDIFGEDWAEREREKLRETFLVILDRLSLHFFKKGKYQLAINLGKKMLEKDQCMEEVHRRLMHCYQQLGMREKAIRQYQKCWEALNRELEVAPSKLTIELFEKIRKT